MLLCVALQVQKTARRQQVLPTAGGVAAIVAVLLRDNPPVAGLGPVRCVAISPAAVFSGQLADGCRDFVTSLILR